MNEDNSERVTFVGVDNWNRPVFQSLQHPRNYFGSVHKLFSCDAEEQVVLGDMEVSDLCYFGDHFGCEPEGTQGSKPLTIVLNDDVEEMPKLHYIPPTKRKHTQC